MPVVSEEDVRVRMLECRMRGEKPPSRCPLCWDEVHIESQDHPYGESYVTEFLHMCCPTCGILYDCRECYRYILHEPEKHPCPDKLLKNQMCNCPPADASSSSTDPSNAPPPSGTALTDWPPKPSATEASLRAMKRSALKKARGW